MTGFLRRGDVRLTILIITLLMIAVVLYSRTDGINFNFRSGSDAPPGFYRIDQFIDGDTIAVDMNGTTEIIRMIGVDTPETHRPNTPVQCFGQAAADFTKKLINKNPVRLEADPLNTNRDRYDRLLRYVYLPDETLVEAKVIDQGYGFAYTSFPFKKAGEFEKLESAAKDNRRGLWSACVVTVQNNGIQQTNPVN